MKRRIAQASFLLLAFLSFLGCLAPAGNENETPCDPALGLCQTALPDDAKSEAHPVNGSVVLMKRGAWTLESRQGHLERPPTVMEGNGWSSSPR